MSVNNVKAYINIHSIFYTHFIHGDIRSLFSPFSITILVLRCHYTYIKSTSQCFTTVTKSVVCAILSVGMNEWMFNDTPASCLWDDAGKISMLPIRKNNPCCLLSLSKWWGEILTTYQTQPIWTHCWGQILPYIRHSQLNTLVGTYPNHTSDTAHSTQCWGLILTIHQTQPTEHIGGGRSYHTSDIAH